MCWLSTDAVKWDTESLRASLQWIPEHAELLPGVWVLFCPLLKQIQFHYTCKMQEIKSDAQSFLGEVSQTSPSDVLPLMLKQNLRPWTSDCNFLQCAVISGRVSWRDRYLSPVSCRFVMFLICLTHINLSHSELNPQISTEFNLKVSRIK